MWKPAQGSPNFTGPIHKAAHVLLPQQANAIQRHDVTFMQLGKAAGGVKLFHSFTIIHIRKSCFVADIDILHRCMLCKKTTSPPLMSTLRFGRHALDLAPARE